METVGTSRAAEMLGLARDTVSAMCREGVFPNAEQDAVRKPWRIPMSDIEEYCRRKAEARKK